MNRYIVISDFDGTITTRDIFDDFCDEFLDKTWREIDLLYHNGNLNLFDAMSKILEMLPVSRLEEIKQFILKNSTIRDGFYDFISFLEVRKIDFTIVSSGFDFYIKILLRADILKKYKIFCNQLTLSEGKIIPKFTYYTKECSICSNCKGLVAEDYRREGYKVIAIGDGMTDRCLVHAADTIFARTSLLDYCQTSKIPCTPFESFTDIMASLKNFCLT